MNHDEFAFFSRQLASMLRDGIPLESGLRELCQGLSNAPTRREIEALEQDLAAGTPLPQALNKRALPELFKRMLVVGAEGNNLPGVLTMLADHYSRVHLAWTRLKGLMVYPAIVLVASLGLSVLLLVLFKRFLHEFPGASWLTSGADEMGILGMARSRGEAFVPFAFWLPPVALAFATAGFFLTISIPSWRSYLRWRLPPFRDASIAQTASALAMILRSGTSLPDALALAGGLEAGTPAARVIKCWAAEVAAGKGKPEQWSVGRAPFPPLFYWLLRQGGEDLAAGFEKAAGLYHGRAGYRIEMMLYGFLPVCVLVLGQVILWQLLPMAYEMSRMMQLFGYMGE